jgi:hypothetical protein
MHLISPHLISSLRDFDVGLDGDTLDDVINVENAATDIRHGCNAFHCHVAGALASSNTLFPMQTGVLPTVAHLIHIATDKYIASGCALANPLTSPSSVT